MSCCWEDETIRGDNEGAGGTWGQVLGKAAGVDQDVGLEGGVKVVICAEEGERMSWNGTSLGFCFRSEVFYLLYSRMSGVQTCSVVKRRFFTPGCSLWFHWR